MNRWLVIGGCAVAVVMGLAGGIKFAGTSVPVSSVQLQAVSSDSQLPAYPPAMGGPDILSVSPRAADIRNKIVDSADLYAAVSHITTQSATIDKLAAAEVLIACADLRPKRQRESSEFAAAQELAVRCAGIQQHLRRNGAVEKAIELRASAEGDPSALGRLAAMVPRVNGDTRGHAEDMALVGDALRSTDSVLIVMAISALHDQLDDGSPDSKLRAHAFANAAESYVIETVGQPTAFDRLVNCANAGRCGNVSGAAQVGRTTVMAGVREQSEVERLERQYRQALRRRDTASELLAIR